MRRILVTGAAGFIGFHLSRSLLADGWQVLGIDSVNDYYDPQVKWDRLELLKKSGDFRFERVSLEDRDTLTSVFQQFKPERVVNLAAQAGCALQV